jgi:hypothetical protein
MTKNQNVGRYGLRQIRMMMVIKGQSQGQSQVDENVTKVDIEPVKNDQIDQEITQNQTSDDQEPETIITSTGHKITAV